MFFVSFANEEALSYILLRNTVSENRINNWWSAGCLD